MDSSPTSLIDKRVLTLIGQYHPPISPDHDAGPALNHLSALVHLRGVTR